MLCLLCLFACGIREDRLVFNPPPPSSSREARDYQWYRAYVGREHISIALILALLLDKEGLTEFTAVLEIYLWPLLVSITLRSGRSIHWTRLQ